MLITIEDVQFDVQRIELLEIYNAWKADKIYIAIDRSGSIWCFDAKPQLTESFYSTWMNVGMNNAKCLGKVVMPEYYDIEDMITTLEK